MAVYTVHAGKTCPGIGTTSTGSELYELDNVTIPTGEQFKRCRIRKAGGTSTVLSYLKLRGSAQDVLGVNGFDTWTTNATAISWSNGKKPKVRVANTDTMAHAYTIYVDIETEGTPTYEIRCYGNTNGNKLTANKETARAGETITLYPVPATGYELTGLTNNQGVTISNNKFTMPAHNINVTASWQKKTYTITKQVNPSGAGSISGDSTGQYGDSRSVSQNANTGYYFNGYTTSPSVSISSGSYTMPASNLTITANYLKRSTGALNKSTLTGGQNAVLTIAADKTTYTHKWKLSFGTNMETELTAVAAGVTSVTIPVPESWSNHIPNAATKTGGTLTLETYNGSTKIGTYTITGLTYAVPESAAPVIGDITASIVRTIGGVTYANVGDYYVQGHCGVEIEAEALGQLSATITGMTAAVNGYAGSAYSGSAADDEIDFTSGLLTEAGVTTLTVTATDSRGRTSTKTTTITVSAYATPGGTLHVWRCDAGGNEDDVEQYAKYALTAQYSEIGSNALTKSITANGVTATVTDSTEFIMPGSGNHLTFATTQEHTITLTLADSFETVTITAKLQSAKFIIYAAADGDRLAFFKASSKAVPTGKDSVMEISGNTQVYIGNDTLEDYIRAIVSAM